MSGTADLVSLESADKPGFFIRLDNHTMQARARRARALAAEHGPAAAQLYLQKGEKRDEQYTRDASFALADPLWQGALQYDGTHEDLAQMQ